MLLTPTLAIRVPAANGPYSLLRDEALDPWVSRLADACRYTMPGNETGLPGINVPAGLDQDGLPIGVQLYGNFAPRGPAAAARRAGRACTAGVVRRGAAGPRDEGRLTQLRDVERTWQRAPRSRFASSPSSASGRSAAASTRCAGSRCCAAALFTLDVTGSGLAVAVVSAARTHADAAARRVRRRDDRSGQTASTCC